MALRVACDLDGTIADMEGALQREAEQLFGPGVVVRPAGSSHLEAPVDPPSPEAAVRQAVDASAEVAANNPKHAERRALSDRQLRELWQHVATIDNFWTTLKEIEPGSVARIAGLRAAHRLEVMFLTQRPDTAGEPAQLQTQRWLAAHGFEFPSVFVLHGSRGRAAAALHIDVVLDDRPENCLEVVTESKARPILVWREPIESVPPGAARLGIETVFSIADALHRIEDLIGATPTPTPKSTFVSRLRNTIGI
jgi:hypothetical protein